MFPRLKEKIISRGILKLRDRKRAKITQFKLKIDPTSFKLIFTAEQVGKSGKILSKKAMHNWATHFFCK
jgi:hypothetical protein